MKGRIVVIVAPSGVGKSTLVKKIKIDFPNLEESISYTTRPMRPGENDGEHYHFITKERFYQMRDSGEFLEWAEVHQNLYGTSKKAVEKCLAADKNLIFDLDVQGADAFKKHFGKDAVAIFIAPPSLEELERRLRGRATETEEVIQIRIDNARHEVLKKDTYDHLIINDHLDRAYKELKTIISKALERG